MSERDYLPPPPAGFPGRSAPPRGDGAEAPTPPPPDSHPGRTEPPRLGRPAHAKRSGDARQELRTLARGGSLSLVGMVTNAILGFAFVVIVSHTLHLSAAGSLFEATAAFSICAQTAELGADTGLLRNMVIFRHRRPQDSKRLATVALVPSGLMAILVAVAVFLFAPQIAHVFVTHGDLRTHHDAPEQLRFLAVFLPLQTTMTVMLAGTRGWSIRPSVFVTFFVVPAARLIFLGGFVILGMTAITATMAWGVPLAIGFGVTAYVLLTNLRRDERDLTATAAEVPAPYWEIAKTFWKFSLPRSLAGIFQVIIQWLDVLLVGALMSVAAAAPYTVAGRYVTIGVFALQAIAFAIAPNVSRLIDARQLPEARRLYQSSSWWAMGISWPILLVLSVFAPFFMSLFGHKYTEGNVALEIMALGALVSAGTGNNSAVLLMGGKSSANLIISAGSVILNVALNLLLIPHIGLAGGAIALAASILHSNFWNSLLIWRSFRIQPFARGYLVVAGSAVVLYGLIGLAVRATFGTGFAVVAIFSIVATIPYAAAIYAKRDLLDLHAFQALMGRRFSGRTA